MASSPPGKHSVNQYALSRVPSLSLSIHLFCVCAYAYTCGSRLCAILCYLKLEEQLQNSVLSTVWTLTIKLGSGAQWQVPLPTEPSRRPPPPAFLITALLQKTTNSNNHRKHKVEAREDPTAEDISFSRTKCLPSSLVNHKIEEFPSPPRSPCQVLTIFAGPLIGRPSWLTRQHCWMQSLPTPQGWRPITWLRASDWWFWLVSHTLNHSIHPNFDTAPLPGVIHCISEYLGYEFSTMKNKGSPLS